MGLAPAYDGKPAVCYKHYSKEEKMRKNKLLNFLIAVLLVLTLSPAIAPAGGVALYEISNAEVRLASAGMAARAQDASTLFTNPAGMSMLDESELLVNMQPLYMKADFSADATTTVSGGDGDSNGWMLSGSTFYVHSLTPDIKLGIGALSYFGLGLDYGSTWSGRYYLEETTLMGLTIMPSISYRINKSFSVGAGLNAMYGIFENSSAVRNLLQDDGKLEIEDTDWGYGFNLGLLYEQNKGTRYGLTYMSEVKLDFEDNPEYTGPAASIGNILNIISGLDMGMTVPQMVMFSAYHELDDEWAIMGNVGWQDWSEFGKINATAVINIPNIGSGTISEKIDSDYDDTWHVAFGVQRRASEQWLVSCGMAYDSAMLDDDNRTLDLPNGETWRLGAGAQYKIRENLELGFAYELGWSGDLSVEQETRSGNTVVRRVAGEFENAQMHFLNFSIKWKI